MSRSSILLMDDTQGQVNVTGEPVRADAWYGLTDGVHTVAIYLQNFIGRIWIEASLSNNPTEDEWFPINLNGLKPYLEYTAADGEEIHNPTNVSMEHTGKSGVVAFTFIGNFLYLRARLDRSYIKPVPKDHIAINQLGVIKKILLNH